MPKATSHHPSSLGLTASAALLLSVLLPASFVQAQSTAYINPTANGTYSDWRDDDYTYVNQGAGCVAGGETLYWSSRPASTGGSGDRASVVIAIPASIPADATIDSVDVQVCQAKAVGGTTGATFQTFIRTDATDLDSGTDITAADPSANLTPNIQTIPVNALRSSITALEAGVLKTNDIDFQRIYTIAARINYTPVTPPAPPTATAVPIFGPFGLLLTMLGLGIIGAWQARRNKA